MLSWSTGAWPARNRRPPPFGSAWHCQGFHWSMDQTMWPFAQSLWLLRRKACRIWLVMFTWDDWWEQPPWPTEVSSLIHGKHKEVVGVNHRNSGGVLRQFSLVKRAGCQWRQWFGIKGLQSQAVQRYVWTVTGVIDSPLVVSPGDHLTSLLTFFFNDLYKIQYFGICIWINPKLVRSVPPSFLPPSFSFVDGPQQRVGDALGTAGSPLCPVAGVEQTPHRCISDCGHVARKCGLEAKGERLMCSRCWRDLANTCHPVQGSTSTRAAMGLVPSQHLLPGLPFGSHGNNFTVAREFF